MKSKFLIALIPLSGLVPHALAMEEGSTSQSTEKSKTLEYRDPKITFEPKVATLTDLSSRDEIAKYLCNGFPNEKNQAKEAIRSLYEKKNAYARIMYRGLDTRDMVIKMRHVDTDKILLYGLILQTTKVRHAVFYSPADYRLAFCKNGKPFACMRSILMKAPLMPSPKSLFDFLQVYGIETINYVQDSQGINVKHDDTATAQLLSEALYAPFRKMDPEFNEDMPGLTDDFIFESTEL